MATSARSVTSRVDPIPFGAAAGAPAWTRGPRLGGFVHAGRLERRARRQVLEPGDLVLQGLVVVAQVAVVETQLLDLLLQSIDLAGQIRDEQAQGLLGQGLGGISRARVMPGLNHGYRSEGIVAPQNAPVTLKATLRRNC